jgi:hypothetical protein
VIFDHPHNADVRMARGYGIRARLVRRSRTGAATTFAVMFVLCQSPVRSPARDQALGPSFPTGPPTTPPSPPSCGWLCPTSPSSCATSRLAAATTASPAVECRPIRPVRADPPRQTILTTTTTGATTTTGTTTTNPAEGHRRGRLEPSERGSRDSLRFGQLPRDVPHAAVAGAAKCVDAQSVFARLDPATAHRTS